MTINILPTITTTHADWLKQIEEADRLGIKQVAFFPTCLDFAARQKAYQVLEKSGLQEIPFVHLRHDIKGSEIAFFIKRWQTRVFNFHTAVDFGPLDASCAPYQEKIYLENTILPWSPVEVEDCAGICIDFSHLEAARLADSAVYAQDIKIIEKHFCGCAHASAIKSDKFFRPRTNSYLYDSHRLGGLSELDYLKRYPSLYFPAYIAIELENGLAEQLVIKKYISNILKSKGLCA